MSLTFRLDGGSIAAKVQSLDAKATASRALEQIKTTPLLASRAVSPPVAPSGGAGVSLRFCPAPEQTKTETKTQTVFEPVLSFARFVPAAGMPKAPTQPKPDECADQFHVPAEGREGCDRFGQLLYHVCCAHKLVGQEGKRISPLLGPEGHIERMNARTHVVGGVLFAVYAVLRHALTAFDDDSTSGTLVSIAAWAIAATFITSSVYHATAPDRTLAYYTRLADFSAIYIAITIGAVADISVASRGFVGVPLTVILDVPLAGLAILVFFLWRRVSIPSEETWGEDREDEGCTIGKGLFYRQHFDKHHSALRSATSLLLAVAYFSYLPCLFLNFELTIALVVFGLQLLSFLLITFGTTLDKIIGFPDSKLAKGEMTCLACSGSVMTTHAIWHIVALVSAALAVSAREVALFHS